MVPKDGVVMEIFGWVEPEVTSLLPSNSSAPISIDIGLNPPLSASYIPQELEVQLIMGLLKHIAVRHLQQVKHQ